MFLRLFLKILNPYKGFVGKKDNLLHKIRLFFYCRIIRCLSIFYTRYANEDVIELGHIKIYQSQRDMQFEQWLTQLKIDIKPHLKHANTLPATKKTRWWRPFYNFFRMETITSCSYGKYEIVLHRSPELWMTTNINGNLEMSDERDILQRSRFKASSLFIERLNIADKSKICSSSWIEKNKSSSGKVSLGETRLPFSNSEEIKTESSIYLVKKVQGAEVDESF